MSQDNNFISQFVDVLVQDAKMGETDADFEFAYKKRLELLVANRIGVEASSMLPDESAQGFAELMKSEPSPEKIFDFFQSNIPDFPQKVVGIMQTIRDEFVSRAEAIKDQQSVASVTQTA